MCLRLLYPVGAFHYLVLGTLDLHSFDPPEAQLNHQAPCLGIPKGRLVLWFLELAPHKPGGGSLGSLLDVPLTPMGPSFVDHVLSIVNADHVVRVIEPPGDDLEGVTELPCPPKPPPPPASKLKVHLRESRRVSKPPPTHSKARMRPPSKAWKARRPGRNLPWPLLPQRRTPVPRSSSAESGAKCRIARPKMHSACT